MTEDQVIGKTMEETENMDWLGYWPVINTDGIIQGIVEADSVPEEAIMVDWKNGQAVEVDGQFGFDAILE